MVSGGVDTTLRVWDTNSADLTSTLLGHSGAVWDVDFSMDCQSGWIFTSGKAVFTGRATNYFSGTTTEALTFTVSP